jgi:tetratricopeptide (TPR) repeat protein
MAPCVLALVAGNGCATHNQHAPELSESQATLIRQRDLVERGLAFSRSGDWERAEEYLSAALDAGAAADEVLPALLHSCIAARRYRTAAEHAQDNLPGLRRRLPEVELILAALYLNLDEPESALQLMNRVVDAQPDNATAHYLLGQTLRERFQELEKADLHFRRYLELEPYGRYSELARGGLLTFVAPRGNMLGAEEATVEAVPVKVSSQELLRQNDVNHATPPPQASLPVGPAAQAVARGSGTSTP